MPQMCFAQLILHIRVVFIYYWFIWLLTIFLNISLHHACIVCLIAEM